MAFAAGSAIAAYMSPRWRAVGLPYLNGYGKNVEFAAVMGAIAAPVLWRKTAGRRWGILLGGGIAALGYAIAARRVEPSLLLSPWRELASAAIWVTALSSGAPWARPITKQDRSRSWLLAVLTAVGAAAFVLGLEPLEVDVFHHGEVLATAVDLVHGGIPFRTLLWPHGLHDTGLTALWILLTGKVGTSPIALATATCRALGVFAVYGLARLARWDRLPALLVATLFVAPLVVAADPHSGGQQDALYRLGILVFVVAGWRVLDATRGIAGTACAGAILALGHLVRFEAGLYGLAAALVLTVDRAWARRDGAVAGLREATVHAAALLLGFAFVSAACFAIVGWPGAEWIRYVFVELPTYHRDAMGLPFPWPLRGAGAASTFAPALGWFALVGWLAVAVPGVRAADPDRKNGVANPVILLAVFGLLAMRSSLERSDALHVQQWSVLTTQGVVLLALALLRDRAELRAAGCLLALALASATFDPIALRVRMPGLPLPSDGAARIAGQLALLGMHLRPNPPRGECADTMFTAVEAESERNSRFIADACALENLLRARGVSRLAILHSAPWYYPRLGMAPPTRYFAPARAYSAGSQLELVGELRANHVDGLLRVRGYGALSEFDVPDGLRVPVVEAYLRERSASASPAVTGIGDVFVWSSPAVCSPRDPPVPRRSNGEAASDISVEIRRGAWDPTSGALVLDAIARGPSGPASVASLRAARFGEAMRGPSSPVPRAAATEATAWQLAGFATRDEVERLRAGALVEISAERHDGRNERIDAKATSVRELPGLDGADPLEMRAAIATASALGARDRIGACESRRVMR